MFVSRRNFVAGRRLGSAVVGLAAALVLASSASSHTQTRLDPDDTAGPLDVVAARQSHDPARRGTAVSFTLVTYEEWSDSDVGGVRRFVALEFDLDGDDVADRCFVVSSRGETLPLEGQMYDGCSYLGDEPVGRARFVERPDTHSVVATFPRRSLGPGRTDYRWRASTSFEASGHPECEPAEGAPAGGYGTCVDFTTWKRHRP